MKPLKVIGICLIAASPLVVSDSASAETFTPAPTTSFDCARTTATIEKLVCRDPQLLRMEKELTRLYRLALTDVHGVPPPDKVVTDQQFWALARNQCASDAQPRACTVQRYAERAYQLRLGSAIVRTKDPDRLTEGPVTYRCAGLPAPLAVTFFNANPDVVYLRWANNGVTLNQAPSAMGLKYTAAGYSFWQTDGQALLQLPGGRKMSCSVEPTG